MLIILCSRYWSFFYEAYWWFDREGAVLMDFSPIGQAVESILPKDVYIANGYGMDVGSLKYAIKVWKKNDLNCCPTGGNVSISFKVANGKIVITGKRYTPPTNK